MNACVTESGGHTAPAIFNFSEAKPAIAAVYPTGSRSNVVALAFGPDGNV